MHKEEEKFAESSLMEGMTSIRAVLSRMESHPQSCTKIHRVLYDRAKLKKISKEINWLKKMSEIHGFTVEDASADTIDFFCTGQSHGGIVAFTRARTIPSLGEAKEQLRGGRFYVMIEGIEDPYNFGYAIRSLHAFGVDGIILPMRNWMTASGVVARASAGASELIDIYTATPEDAADIFHELGYQILSAKENAPISLQEASLPYPIFAVVGGEKRGISSVLQSKTDIAVRIEYGREFKASLSAASAATVLAYEVTKQNQYKQ